LRLAGVRLRGIVNETRLLLRLLIEDVLNSRSIERDDRAERVAVPVPETAAVDVREHRAHGVLEWRVLESGRPRRVSDVSSLVAERNVGARTGCHHAARERLALGESSLEQTLP